MRQVHNKTNDSDYVISWAYAGFVRRGPIFFEFGRAELSAAKRYAACGGAMRLLGGFGDMLP